MSKPLDCMGVSADGVGKHDFRLHVERDGPHLYGTLPEVPGLIVTADSEPDLTAEAVGGLAALYLAQRDQITALKGRLDAIRSLLVPLSEEDWPGRGPINKAIEMTGR